MKEKQKLRLDIILKKYLDWESLFKYEEVYLWKKLRDNADTVFKKRIRDRDKWKWCVSFGANACKDKVEHACHRIEAWWFSHRWDEDNVNWWCSTCNWYNKREHQMYYDLWIVNKYWKEWAEKQLFEKNKIKPTIDEMLAIIEKYKT